MYLPLRTNAALSALKNTVSIIEFICILFICAATSVVNAAFRSNCSFSSCFCSAFVVDATHAAKSSYATSSTHTASLSAAFVFMHLSTFVIFDKFYKLAAIDFVAVLRKPHLPISLLSLLGLPLLFTFSYLLAMLLKVEVLVLSWLLYSFSLTNFYLPYVLRMLFLVVMSLLEFVLLFHPHCCSSDCR